MSRRWPPPGYEMVNEEGLPHERLFTIACVVFKHRETGWLEDLSTGVVVHWNIISSTVIQE